MGADLGARMPAVLVEMGFITNPAEEKRLWHSHVHEVRSGQLIAPGIPQVAEHELMEKLVRMGGSGGVVAMDPQGVPSFPFNTSGMYRGWVTSAAPALVAAAAGDLGHCR